MKKRIMESIVTENVDPKKVKPLSSASASFLEENFLPLFSFKTFVAESDVPVHSFAKYKILPRRRSPFSDSKFPIWSELFDSVQISEDGFVDTLCRQEASIEYFNLFYSKKPEWFHLKSLAYLFEKPSILHLEWIIEKKFELNQPIDLEGEKLHPIDISAKRANVAEIKWLCDHKSHWSDNAFKRSVIGDNLPVFVWLMEQRDPRELSVQNLLSIATENLSKEVIWWVIENKIGEIDMYSFKTELFSSVIAFAKKTRLFSDQQMDDLKEKVKELPLCDELEL